ncbi:glyoxalase [Paracoccus suum]|uniref:Glyoxalase n=2 Tax=Paracoccus suum TaxID=2259340 RepID=A0A344PNL1_9RHOB|nr:glyoxalase [Paracoccus suum]
MAIHHVQLAMPRGGEGSARRFYVQVSGLTEIENPDTLQGRGGVWFFRPGVQVHLGLEEPFSPARKAHPAFQVASLQQTEQHLANLGLEFHRDVDLPKIRRIYVDDPFGNRIELLEII